MCAQRTQRPPTRAKVKLSNVRWMVREPCALARPVACRGFACWSTRGYRVCDCASCETLIARCDKIIRRASDRRRRLSTMVDRVRCQPHLKSVTISGRRNKPSAMRTPSSTKRVLAGARAGPLVLHKNICVTPKVQRFGGTVLECTKQNTAS